MLSVYPGSTCSSSIRRYVVLTCCPHFQSSTTAIDSGLEAWRPAAQNGPSANNHFWKKYIFCCCCWYGIINSSYVIASQIRFWQIKPTASSSIRLKILARTLVVALLLAVVQGTKLVGQSSLRSSGVHHVVIVSHWSIVSWMDEWTVQGPNE